MTTDPNDLLLEGWAACSQCSLEVASRELEALKDWLDERGADLHVTYRVSLPTSVPAGDPKRCSRTIEGLRDRTYAVYQLVAKQGDYGMTSKELNTLYAAFSRRAPGVYPPQDLDSPRKRLPDLARAGHLRKTDRERDGAAVWVASDALGVRSAA